MSLIETIQKKLESYPQAAYELRDQAVLVHPQSSNGFRVMLSQQDEKWTVAFEGWHEEFTHEEEALHCFALGLSNACRLKVCYRGDKAYKWTLELKEGGNWQEDSTISTVSLAFWKQEQVAYLQNDLIQLE